MSLRCLIAIPWIKDKDSGSYQVFPVGIAYVSASLKRLKGVELSCLNLNHVGPDWAEFLEKTIRESGAQALLTGGLSAAYGSISNLLAAGRRGNPQIITVVGGGLISGDAEAALEALELADYGVIGEGELAVAALVEALRDGGDPRRIPGLILRGADGRLELTAPAMAPAHIDALPRCDYESFDFSAYLAQDNYQAYHAMLAKKGYPAPTIEGPPLPLVSSRSCVNRCTFCFHLAGHPYRRRHLDEVFNELDSLLAKFEISNIKLIDEMIGTPFDRLEEFCRRIKNYDLPWTTNFRVKEFSPEAARLLKDSGCVNVCLGLESADDRILASMKKGTTVDRIERALAIGAEAQLHVTGNFIFGDPEESLESSLGTLEWYLNHPQYDLNIFPMQFYPGTAIYWRAVAEGRIGDRAEYLRQGRTRLNGTRMSDDQYWPLIEQTLPEYRHKKIARLPKITEVRLSHQLDEHKLRLQGRCAGCGAWLHFSNVQAALVSRWVPLICGRCATLQAFPEDYYLASLSRNLDFLVTAYGPTAIWGVGQIFRRWVPESFAWRKNLHLLDRRLNGSTFGAKTIEAPEVIKNAGVKALVLPPHYRTDEGREPFREIWREAVQDFGLRHFIDFYDLFFFDLRENRRVRPEPEDKAWYGPYLL